MERVCIGNRVCKCSTKKYTRKRYACIQFERLCFHDAFEDGRTALDGTNALYGRRRYICTHFVFCKLCVIRTKSNVSNKLSAKCVSPLFCPLAHSHHWLGRLRIYGARLSMAIRRFVGTRATHMQGRKQRRPVPIPTSINSKTEYGSCDDNLLFRTRKQHKNNKIRNRLHV